MCSNGISNVVLAVCVLDLWVVCNAANQCAFCEVWLYGAGGELTGSGAEGGTGEHYEIERLEEVDLGWI